MRFETRTYLKSIPCGCQSNSSLNDARIAENSKVAKKVVLLLAACCRQNDSAPVLLADNVTAREALSTKRGSG